MLFQVGHIKRGANPASASEIFFSGKYLGPGIRIGVVSGMIALTVRKLEILQMNTYISDTNIHLKQI